MQNLWNGRIYQMFQLPQDYLRKEGYLTVLGLEKYLKHLSDCIS